MRRLYLDESGQQWLAETTPTGQTFWQKVGAALTDPDKAFSLPVVYPVELSKPTRNVILGASIVLGVSLVAAAYFNSNKHGKR